MGYTGHQGRRQFKIRCRWSHSTSRALESLIQFIKTKRPLEQTKTSRQIVSIGTKLSNTSSTRVLYSILRSQNKVPRFFRSKMTTVMTTKIKRLNHVNIMKLTSSSDDKRKKPLQTTVIKGTLTQRRSIKLENYCN